jgi:hypothetical protein
VIVEEKRSRGSSSRSEAARSDPGGPPLPAGTSGSEARSGKGPSSAAWSGHLFCIAVPLLLSCHKMNTQYS